MTSLTRPAPMQESPNAGLARDCAAVARDILLVAFEAETVDKAHLAEASQFFMQALALDVSCLDAVLGLSYLSALTGAYARALELIDTARAIDASDRRIKPLASQIRRLQELDMRDILKRPEQSADTDEASDVPRPGLIQRLRLDEDSEDDEVESDSFDDSDVESDGEDNAYQDFELKAFDTDSLPDI